MAICARAILGACFACFLVDLIRTFGILKLCFFQYTQRENVEISKKQNDDFRGENDEMYSPTLSIFTVYDFGGIL